MAERYIRPTGNLYKRRMFLNVCACLLSFSHYKFGMKIHPTLHLVDELLLLLPNNP